MENLNIKINLSRLNDVCRISDKNGIEYVAIPIKKNFLYQGEKGTYLNLTAFCQDNDKYGDSHYIKLQIPSATYNKMTDDEKKKQNIIGSARTFVLEDKTLKEVDNQGFTNLEGQEDLPF